MNDEFNKSLWRIPIYLSWLALGGFLFFTMTLDKSPASIFFLYILPFSLFYGALLGVALTKVDDSFTNQQGIGAFVFFAGFIMILYLSPIFITPVFGHGLFSDLIGLIPYICLGWLCVKKFNLGGRNSSSR